MAEETTAAPAASPSPSPAPSAPAEKAAPVISKESVAKTAETLRADRAAKPPAGEKVQASTPAATPASKPAEAAPNANNKPGYDPVDFSKLPPELRQEFEPRFHRVYGQMKAQDDQLTALREHNSKMSERLEKLLEKDATSGHESQLAVAQRKVDAARISGDQMALTEAILDMRALKEKGAPQVEKLTTPPPATAAQTKQVFTEDDSKAIDTWARSRPWTDKTHPYYETGLTLGSKLFDHPSNEGKPAAEILAQLDKAMYGLVGQQAEQPQNPAPNINTATNAQPQVANVLSQRVAPRQAAAPTETKLNENQRRVAHNMFRNLSKKEAEAMYAKQLTFIQH